MAGSGANGAQMLRCWDHPLNKEDLWRPLSARGRSVRDHCRLVQSSRLKTPSLKENPRPIRGAKALQQLYDLEPKTCCSSPEPRDLAQEVLTAAENWPVDEDGINPELDPGSAGVNLGLDAKDRFYGRMSGVEVEKELIRLAVLLQSLLRDFGLMKDTFGHLQDEQHSVKELMLQNSSACTAQVVDLQKEVEDKMKWLSAQVVDGTWTVAQCQKDTSAKCQVLREELDGKLESHKHNFEDFREEAGRRFDSSSQSLEEGLERLTERMDCNEQARKALRIDAFNEMAHARQAAHDLRQSDQEQMNKKFSAMQAVQESMQQACCTVEGKVDAAWEALQDVQEKIVIVSEENVSKFVLAENGVAEVQQKVNEVHEETTRGRLATEVVIDELQKELLAVKKAGSSLLTSEFSRDESQPGHVAGLGDFQVSHMSRASSEMPITLTQSSNEERLDVLELQVQRTAENQKILEEELFERLKEFELQARRTPEGPEGPDISERLDYFDHQVHLAAQSQRSLAEDLFQRLDELEQQVHSSYNQELLELLENLEIQVRQGGERQEELESEVQQLQENFGVSRRIQHGAEESDRTPLEQSVEDSERTTERSAMEERVVEDRDAQEEPGETPIDLTDEESPARPSHSSLTEERVVEDRDAQEEPGETPIDLTDEESPARPSDSSLTEDESERSPARRSAEESDRTPTDRSAMEERVVEDRDAQEEPGETPIDLTDEESPARPSDSSLTEEPVRDDPFGKPAPKDSERTPKHLLAKQEPSKDIPSPSKEPLQPRIQVVSPKAKVGALPPLASGISGTGEATGLTPSSPAAPTPRLPPRPLSASSAKSHASQESQSSGSIHPEMQKLISRLSMGSGSSQAPPMASRSASDSKLVKTESLAVTASRMLADALHLFSGDLRRAADNLSRHPSKEAPLASISEPSQPSPESSLRRRSTEPSVSASQLQLQPSSPSRDLGGRAIAAAQDSPQSPVMATMSRQYSPQSPVMATMSRQYSPQSPVMATMSRQYSPQSPVMATMSRQYSPQSPVMATMSRQYSPQSPAMSRQPSTGSSALSFGPGKSIGGSQAAPEQVLQSPMSRQTSESSDSRTAGQQGRPKGLAQPSGPGRSFGAGSQAVPEEAAEALTSGLLPLSTVQQLVSSDYLLLPSEEEEGLARQLALLTELGKEKAAQLGEKFKEEMPKPSKPPGSPGLPGSPVVPRRELVSSQAASSAGSPKGPKGATGRPRVGKASQEKPEPQAAARGHEAEGDPITAEMASPQTAEMEKPEPQAAARGHEAEGDPITAEMASPQTAEMVSQEKPEPQAAARGQEAEGDPITAEMASPQTAEMASQEKPEPQAAARGHEAEGDPITAEMASPQTAEMDQQSHSSGMAESDAAGNATFASHFLGPQEEESPHPQLTDQPLWTGARGPVAPMALDEEESSLSDLDFLS